MYLVRRAVSARDIEEAVGPLTMMVFGLSSGVPQIWRVRGR